MTRTARIRRRLPGLLIGAALLLGAMVAAMGMWAYQATEVRHVAGQFAVSALDIAPDGSVIAVGYKDGVLEVRDARDPEQVIWRERNTSSTASQVFFVAVPDRASATREEITKERRSTDNVPPPQSVYEEDTPQAEATEPDFPEQQQMAEPDPAPTVLSGPLDLPPGLYLFIAKADGYLEIREAMTGDHARAKSEFPRSLAAPQMARAEDGTLWVSGRDPGQGSFLLRFPVGGDVVEMIPPEAVRLVRASPDGLYTYDDSAPGDAADFFYSVPILKLSSPGAESVHLEGSNGIRGVLTYRQGDRPAWNLLLGDRDGNGSIGLSGGRTALTLVSSPDRWLVLPSPLPTEFDLDVLTRPVPIRLEGHVGPVLAIAYAPDAPVIASGGADGSVLLWHQDASGFWSSSLVGQHDDSVLTIGFRPDGQALVSGAADGTAIAWSWHDDEGWVGERLSGHDGAVNRAIFAPGGGRIITGSEDMTVRIWQRAPDTGPWEDTVLTGHEGPVLDLAISRDGALLISASADRMARLWSLDNLSGSSRPLGPHNARVISTLFSPDADIAATISADRTARTFEGSSFEPGEIYTFETAGSDFTFAQIMPSGNGIATLSESGVAEIWDEGSGETFEGLSLDLGDVQATAISFSSDEDFVAVGDSTGAITIWEGDADEISPATAPQPCGDVLRGGAVLAGTAEDGADRALWLMSRSAGICRLAFDDSMQPIVHPWAGDVAAAVFLPGETGSTPTRAIVGLDSGGAELVDLVTGEVTARYGGHEAAVRHIAFSMSDTGIRLVLGSDDGVVQLVDLPRSGTPALARADMAVRSAVASADRSRLTLLDTLFPGTGRRETPGQNILAAYQNDAEAPAPPLLEAPGQTGSRDQLEDTFEAVEEALVQDTYEAATEAEDSEPLAAE